MTWGQLHRRGDLWAACKAKNKKFPGGLRRRGNSRPSKKHVPRENRAVLQARVAPVWPKLKTVTKLQGISWWGILFGITSYWDGFFSFLIFLSNFYSRQVEIEQKKSLKPDFEGEEMENPKECGVQWWSPLAGGAWPKRHDRTSSWAAGVQGSTYHGYSLLEQYVGLSCLWLPVISQETLRWLLRRDSDMPEAGGVPDFWSLLSN